MDHQSEYLTRDSKSENINKNFCANDDSFIKRPHLASKSINRKRFGLTRNDVNSTEVANWISNLPMKSSTSTQFKAGDWMNHTDDEMAASCIALSRRSQPCLLIPMRVSDVQVLDHSIGIGPFSQPQHTKVRVYSSIIPLMAPTKLFQCVKCQGQSVIL